MAVTLLHNQIQDSLAQQEEWEKQDDRILKEKADVDDKDLIEQLVEKLGQGIIRQGGNY